MVMSLKKRKEIANSRRKAILDAAIALFDDQGYENTKMTEIAAKANISAGLIYHYFNSKVAILRSYGDMIVDCQNYVLGLPTPKESLRAFCRRVLLPYQKTHYHSPIRIIISCYAHGTISEIDDIFPFSTYGQSFLGLIIKQGQEQGEFCAGDPEKIGDIIWHTIIGYIVYRFNYEPHRQVTPPIDEMLSLIERKH